jgi:hypothetical protein
MFIVYSDPPIELMCDFNMKARRLAGRYVPSFTEAVYFGDRPDIDRSLFAGATAASGGQFYTDLHFVLGALASPRGFGTSPYSRDVSWLALRRYHSACPRAGRFL